MSAQTGTPSFVPGPPSSRAVDLARVSIRKAQDDPNPIWIRELKQAGRLQRTPIVLMTVTALVALLMCAIGGIMSVTADPAITGVALFHTFFSVAFFVVTLVGPALAANSVASEREGRTWEAVILTGLRPHTIARGKFLSSLTAIVMYIVMLAPVGALPFLFGGVTALEVVVAFAFLLLFAVLSVAFGLSISSALASGRTAIVVTLLVAFPLTVLAYIFLGPVLSLAAHEVWPSVLEGAPVWLPTAYERAPFSLEYVAFLMLVPLAAVLAPAWFFYEVTIANLTSATDDRSTGLKRWFAVMCPAVVLAAAVPAAIVPKPSAGHAMAITALLLFLIFSIFVFQGDAIGPSRRVLVHWDRRKAGWLTRFFGPGLVRTFTLVLLAGAAGLGFIALLGVAVSQLAPWVTSTSRMLESERIVGFFVYAGSYFLFLGGFAAWIRTKSSTAGIARVMLVVALFLTAAGPWIVAAIAGVIADKTSDALVVAAPSPFYVIVLMDALDGADRAIAIVAGTVCSFAWALIGLGLFAAAGTRAKAIINKHHEMLAKADALLEQEDAARQEAAQAADETAPKETPEGGANETLPSP